MRADASQLNRICARQSKQEWRLEAHMITNTHTTISAKSRFFISLITYIIIVLYELVVQMQSTYHCLYQQVVPLVV